MTLTARTGNTPRNTNRHGSGRLRTAASPPGRTSAAAATGTTSVRTGTSVREAFRTSSKTSSAATPAAADAPPGTRASDYTAELHLTLRDAAQTHKQTLNVNGRNIRITVPAGMADGQVIKLKGQGGPGANGGPAGDLYITFVVEPDPVFTRRGNDLYATADIDLYTAVLGGEATIDTLDGKVKLKVAPETQNGTKVRLRGKGFPVYKQEGQCGDLIVTYNVKVPTHLTERQRELFKQLANS